MGGPAPVRIPDLSRRLLAARGDGRRVVPLVLPGRVGRLMRDGALLPTGRWEIGPTTVERWLAEQTPGDGRLVDSGG